MMDAFELTFGTALASLFVVIVAVMASYIGYEAWSASEKAAAYQAYTQCLEVMKQQPIDVQQTFCGKIREQL